MKSLLSSSSITQREQVIQLCSFPYQRFAFGRCTKNPSAPSETPVELTAQAGYILLKGWVEFLIAKPKTATEE